MNATKKGLLASLIAATLLGGCGGAEDIPASGGVTPPDNGGGDSSLLLLGVGATASTTPRVQSEMDGWNVQAVTATPVAMTSISAVLINNAGTNDTVDVKVAGNGDGTFMLKTDTPLDLSKYASGFIEFQLRAKSAVPEVLNASIDNEYPNRSSLPIASAVKGGGNWETLTLPINCMKPFSGATAINLASVASPFHLATKEAFDYEITNVKYKLTTTETPVVDPVTCEAAGGGNPDTGGDTGSGVNQAPALAAADAALYYSGDKSLATDRSASYPVYHDATVTEADQVVTADLPGNGFAFLGDDSSNSDLSAYQAGAMTLDVKVTSYGASPNIQIRMDGTAGPDFGTFFTMDSSKVPADDSWYRCTLPVASLIPAAHINSVQKALFMAGAWDSMAGLKFSFTNVALKSAVPADFDANSPCQKIAL